MNDSSYKSSYFLWHIARLLVTAAIIGFPITLAFYGLSKFA